MRSLRLVTDATAEPVSLEDLKTQIRLASTETDEDALLEGLITVARKAAENKTRRACLPQTWQLKLDDFADEMVLPRAPLSSASTDVVITYLDAASGNSTTLPSTHYTVDADSEPGRVFLAYDSEWPDVYPVPNAVTITFKAGYPVTTSAPTTDTCPKAMETWIKMRAAALYEQRESHLLAGFGGQAFQELPHSFYDGLLDDLVLIEVGP